MTPDMARAIHRLRDASAIGCRASIVSRALGMILFASLALVGCNMGGRPQGQTTAPPAPQPTIAAPADVPSGTYVVVGGDTVHAVANRFGVPIRSLIELNNKYYRSPVLSMSIGTATAPEPGSRLTEALRTADDLMYVEKRRHHAARP